VFSVFFSSFLNRARVLSGRFDSLVTSIARAGPSPVDQGWISGAPCSLTFRSPFFLPDPLKSSQLEDHSGGVHVFSSRAIEIFVQDSGLLPVSGFLSLLLTLSCPVTALLCGFFDFPGGSSSPLRSMSLLFFYPSRLHAESDCYAVLLRFVFL